MKGIHPAGSGLLPGLGAVCLGLATIAACIGPETTDQQLLVFMLAAFFSLLSVVLFGLWFFAWILMRHEFWKRNLPDEE